MLYLKALDKQKQISFKKNTQKENQSHGWNEQNGSENQQS